VPVQPTCIHVLVGEKDAMTGINRLMLP
jgi:hypothetical protein